MMELNLMYYYVSVFFHFDYFPNIKLHLKNKSGKVESLFINLLFYKKKVILGSYKNPNFKIYYS